MSRHLLTSIIVGIALSSIISTSVVRTMLFTPGLIEWGDVLFHRDIARYTVAYDSAWDDIGSTPSLPYKFLLFSILTSISGNIETMERVLFFSLFFLTTFIMYMVVWVETATLFKKKKSAYICAGFASILYAVNPFVVGLPGSYAMMLHYALAPLMVFLAIRAICAKSWKAWAKFSLVLSLIFTSNFSTPHTLLLSALLMIFIFLAELGYSIFSRNLVRTLLRGSSLLFTLAVSSFLLNAKFLFHWFELQSEFVTASPWGGLPTETVVRDAVPFFNAVRLYAQPLQVDPTILWQIWRVETGFYGLWVVATLALPLAVGFAIYFARSFRLETKNFYFLLALLIVSLFLSKGGLPPFGDYYVKITSEVPFFWVLKYPAVYVVYVSFALSYLVALFVAKVFDHDFGSFGTRWKMPKLVRRSQFFGVLLSSLLLPANLLGAYPLLTGDVKGLFTPIEVPKQYDELRSWLDEQSDDFRVLWLPYGDQPNWMQHTAGFDISSWLTSRPLLFHKSYTQVFWFDYLWGQLENGKDASDLLGIFSVKYIIYHNDTLDTKNSKRVYNLLLNQKNLQPVHKIDYIYIFENLRYQPYLRPVSQAILAVGGLKLLNILSEFPSFNAGQTAVSFPEARFLAPPTPNITNLLTSEDIILFYNRNFTDIVFNMIDKDHLYALSDYQKYNRAWEIEKNPRGMNLDVDYNKAYVRSLRPGDRFSFVANAALDGSYEVWARVYPETALVTNFKLLIDGSLVGDIELSGEVARGFYWLKVGNVRLQEGHHVVTIVNEGVYAAIGLLAIVPSQTYELVRDNMQQTLVSRNPRVAYFLDSINVPEVQGSKLFEDNFEDSDLPAWRPLNGLWSVEEGDLIQKDRNEEHAEIVLKDYSLENGIIKLEVKLNAGATVGMRLRYLDQDHFYNIYYTAQNNKVYVVAKSGENVWILGQVDFTMNYGQWYNWKIVLSDDKIKFYVDDKLYLFVTDDKSDLAHSQGSVILLTFGETEFDNVAFYEQKPSLTLYAPTDSDYWIALKTKHHNTEFNVRLDGQKLSYTGFNAGWAYFGPIRLVNGWHDIVYQGKGVDMLSLFSPNVEQHATLNDLFLKTSTPPTIEYTKTSAAEWKANLKLSRPAFIAFSEAYHPLWQVQTDKAEYLSIPSYNLMNLFFINDTGQLNLDVKFLSQDNMLIGSYVTSVSFMSIFALLALLVIGHYPKELIQKLVNHRRYVHRMRT